MRDIKLKVYEPKESEHGYMYHVDVYFEALLSNEQVIEIENGPVFKGGPDDDTDYERIAWRKCGRTSFAEKEWNNAVRHTRDILKMSGKSFIAASDDSEYVYFFDTVIGLKEEVLKRAHIYITHQTSICFDNKKFNKHITQIGKTRS
ncbi:hypothetical protein [Oceanobacillus sp. J11TS1]|uniref:hypothetical protein n=1 Tax=Oceanobacillus sp. J11TS1 TaxID=2807191 RepID=UPI001B2AE657|nr:hypothetical protein [Oceanobacillus sp. J11TS1]GIO22455.1 hypothetical protein J11TS1_10360 [Oceanobacillus sp. J11TS1]